MQKIILFFVLLCTLAQSTFAQAPTITSFSPNSGPVGTLVTITGTNLGTPTAFMIGGVDAIVVSKTATQVVGMVMPGTATGVVSITTAGGSVNSGTNFIPTASAVPEVQQDNKLYGTGAIGAAGYASAIDISGDGTTVIIGGPGNNNLEGSAWIYIYSGGMWVQQSNKLIGTGAAGNARQGASVSLSYDGNTALVGGNSDNNGKGAAWVYTRSGNTWTQQGNKLVGSGVNENVGFSVCLSADGNTAILGGGGGTNYSFPVPGGAWVYTRSGGIWTQQGNKLVGTGAIGNACQGYSVSLSDDGNTAILGGHNDNNQGAAWIFTRTAGVWTQQGNKLVGTGTQGQSAQGRAVALSGDGNTAIIGGPIDNISVGAAWIFTRTAGVWTQQGNKLIGGGYIGFQPWIGNCVSLSTDGNTAIIGGFRDNNDVGAAWVFKRNGNVWTQQGNKLVGTGVIGNALQGRCVALTADGNTAIIGGDWDNNYMGALWTFTRNASVWTQQGNKLTSLDFVTYAQQGNSVAVSADGNTAIVGGAYDNNNIGAVWIYTRSGGIWTQQGNKLIGTGAIGTARQGCSVAISADGNTAIVGGFNDNSGIGTAWIFKRNGGVWTQQGNKLIGIGASGNARQGYSVSISADGNTAIIGGNYDYNSRGAVWVFTQSGGTWTQQGNKLSGIGFVGSPAQGGAVSISADGNTIIIGGKLDNNDKGAAWIFVRNGGVWTQQGLKLVGTGGTNSDYQGSSVSISADGNSAIVGGYGYNSNQGAAWIFNRLGNVWTQQGNMLVGTGAIGNASQGSSVSISADGNSAMIGGYADNSNQGAAWVFTYSGGVWTQHGNKLVGTGNVGPAYQGNVSISSDGNTAIIGGQHDYGNEGAVWIYEPQPCLIPTVADAGTDKTSCGTIPVTLTPIGTGIWSGGAGVWNSNNYTPSLLEVGTTITLTWTVIGIGSCGIDTDMVNITVLNSNTPPASISILGPTTFCANTNPTVLQSNTGAGYSYQWMNGNTIIGTNASTYIPDTSGVYTVMTTDSVGCISTSTAATIIVYPLGAIQSALAISCGTINTQLQVIITGSSNPYTLSYSDGTNTATLTNYVSGTSGNIPYLANANYTLLQVTDAAGCDATGNIGAIPLTPNIPPTASIAPQGPTTFCGGVGATVLQAPTGAGYTYQWKRSFYNVGTNSNTYTPTLPGNHKVFITDACGNVSGSTWINVIVNPLPQANAGPDKNLCDGSSIQIGVNSALTYSYSWVPSTGLSNPLIAKPMANPSSNTTYTLYATDINTGCMNTDMVDISILPLPPTPSITSTPSGNLVILTANTPNAASLYWYRNGQGLYANMAPNSSISVYHSNPTKAYTAKSKGANGCLSLASNTLNVRIGQEKGGDDLIGLDESILQAYPNPTNGILHIDIINLDISSGKLRLYNTLGQIVLEEEVNLIAGQANLELDISSFAAGVYSLSFENYTQKIIKE